MIADEVSAYLMGNATGLVFRGERFQIREDEISFERTTLMILWTIQSQEVYDNLMKTGVYRCDFEQSGMREFKSRYRWMAEQMKRRIGPPPDGVQYPVWAWYQWRDDKKKPDLRSERWGNGWKGEEFVRLEVEVPDHEVLLSDFDDWCIALLSHGLISFTEEESNQLDAKFESLPYIQQIEMQRKNWERVFNITPFKNDWTRRGESIQATFWELRKDQIRKARFFTSAQNRPEKEFVYPVIEIRELTVNDGMDVYDMLQTLPTKESGFNNPVIGASTEEYKGWLQKSHADSLRKEITDAGKVPYTTYWLYVDGAPAGIGRIRHFLTEGLRRACGHIGYAIAPAFRGKRHGEEFLHLLLREAKKLGIAQALVTIKTDNERSLHVAMANGGEVMDEVEERYRIWIET